MTTRSVTWLLLFASLAVVSGRDLVNVREGLAGRTLAIGARTDAVKVVRRAAERP
jgi:hypothetical protein